MLGLFWGITVGQDPTNLAERIRDLRRRHFGARGKAALAEKLGVPLDELDRYERGTIPPADKLVRLCEITGEDLQWLLTGVSSRGTVVISGARGRHQSLLARVAQIVESRPQLAAPIEAFLELLSADGKSGPGEPRSLPQNRSFIPIFELSELPDRLELQTGETATLALSYEPPPQGSVENAASMTEPSTRYDNARLHQVRLLRAAGTRNERDFVSCPELADCAAALFGVAIRDDEMAPMFSSGDAAIVAMTSPSHVGRPAVLKVANDRAARCRLWLGENGSKVNLGRISDGAIEQVERQDLLWSFEAIFRVAAA